MTAPSEPLGADRRGILFVLSSPSGAGKTTLSRKLLAEDPEFTLSISATTRPPSGSHVASRSLVADPALSPTGAPSHRPMAYTPPRAVATNASPFGWRPIPSR